MSYFPPDRPRPPKAGDGNPRIPIDVGMLPDLNETAYQDRPPRRVNVKALVILLGLALLVPAVYFPLATIQEGRLRHVALEQARGFAEAGKVDRALVTLDHHLGSWPEDVPALELQARLLTESARAADEILNAANAQDQLLRLDPMGPGRQENRRQLVELYLRHGEWLRYTSTRKELWIDRFQSRHRAALKIAQQRILFGGDDADSHRLLARAYEGLASMGDRKSSSEAAIEYEKALRRDPGDAASAERLAILELERRNEPAGGDEILDALLAAKPDSAGVRLVRHRYFRRTCRAGRAEAELAAATRLAPTDIEVRLAAATEALRRDDAGAARRHLAAIPEGLLGDRRVAVVRGQIELVEGHPEVAVDAWRKGLAAVGGLDRELTWQLASTLIRLGRIAEARPLVARFEKLAGDESNPMSRLLRGTLKERTGHPAAAIAELEPARASIGLDLLADLAMTLGRCYGSLNDDARAATEYRRALEASPLSSAPRRALARLIGKADPEKAAEELEEGIKAVTGPAPLLLDLALIRLDQQRALPPEGRRWKDFEDLLGRLEQAAPEDLDLPRLRAEYLAVTGRRDEAFELLERAARGPARAREDYWLAWAEALAGRGREAEALRVLEEASAPQAAGDHASLRAARAKLLARTGHARAARDLVSADVEKVPAVERAALARARAELLHGLGDHAGSRAACLEWSRLAPEDPQPGLTLLTMAQRGGGDEAARLGLELLRKVGGQDEPYALAARALDLLLSTRAREETRTARFDQADRLIDTLQTIAPQLPVSHLLRGMMLERNHRPDDAIASYRAALRGNARGMALPRLVALLSRLKRDDELAELKESTGEALKIDQLAASASLESGDKERARELVARLVESLPDSLEMRAAQVKLLGEMGRPREAEETLRALARRRPDEPGPWLALVIVQLASKQPEEAARTIEQAAASYKGERADVLQARCRWVVGEKSAAASLLESALAARPTDLATIREADEFFQATGRPDRAEALLRRALKVDPTTSWAARRLALLLSTRPDPASWAEAWSLVAPGGSGSGDAPEDRLARVSVLERCPDAARGAEAGPALLALAEDLPATNPIAIDARGRLARAALDVNRAADAARLIAPVAEESHAVGPATLALAAEALARSGRPEEAGRQLARLLAAEPNSARAVACRAWVFAARGKKADAAATVEDALAEAEGKPEEPALGFSSFNLLNRLGLPEAAERVARRIASRRPRDAWLLAACRAEQGRPAEALASCRIAVDAGAAREPMQVALGLAAARKLDAPQVAEVGSLADRALAKSPDELILIGLVTALRHLEGRYEDELALHRRALELDPTNVLRLNDMAWVLSECLDRPGEAMGRVDEAIRRGGRLPQVTDTRGVILTRLGRHDEAIADLQDAIKGRPAGSYYFHLARAAKKAGRDDLYRKNRDLARKAGIDPSKLDEPERAEFASIMGP